MIGKTLRAIIKDGRIEYQNPEEYNEIIKLLEGLPIVVRIEKWYKRRSNPQNRYYWGVIIDILSESTGEDDLDAIHEALKRKFLPKRTVLGEDVSELSTKKLKTIEFEDYMSKIRMWASRDYNIYIPEPNEAPGYAYEI